MDNKNLLRLFLFGSLVIAIVMYAIVTSRYKDSPGVMIEPTWGATPTRALIATPTAVQTEITPPPMNLKGRTYVFSEMDEETARNWRNSGSAYDEAYYDMIGMYESEYDFKIEVKGSEAAPEEYLAMIRASILEDKPAGDIISVNASQAVSLLTDPSGNLLLAYNDIPGGDAINTKWSRGVSELLTVNGKTYGVYNKANAGVGLYFNKAKLRAAGIDTDALYELQNSRQWDWEAFLSTFGTLFSDKCGTPDCYLLSADAKLTYSALLSNGTFVITKDDRDLLQVNTEAKEVSEALAFVHKLFESGVIYAPSQTAESSRQAFLDGKTAMIIEDMTFLDTLAEQDRIEYGFISFPHGPSAASQLNFFIYGENPVYVIPNCESSREKAEETVFVYQCYSDFPLMFDYGEEDAKMKNRFRYKLEKYLDEASCKTIYNLMYDYPVSVNNSELIADFPQAWAAEAVLSDDAAGILSANKALWEEQVSRFNACFTE
ncbi:MAG: extracellular solute-binding protein [Lachnospiraceae bacterium]|nr:extracellular solute-binding protein [Lachnospiraceae bacterium]